MHNILTKLFLIRNKLLRYKIYIKPNNTFYINLSKIETVVRSQFESENKTNSLGIVN